MTKLVIIDTGYLTSDRDDSGNPNTGTNIADLSSYRANNGTAITLDCESLSLDGGTQLSTEPNPSSADSTKSHFNTFDNEVYTLKFRIDATDSDARNLLKQIAVLRKTTGVKILFPSDSASTIKMLPEILGRTDTRFNTGGNIGGISLAGIPLYVCRIKGIHIDNIASARNYSVTGTLTIEEEQVVV